MPSADLLAEAKAAMEAGDAQHAGELFSALLHQEPENGDAWGGLIRSLMALGQEDQARQALEQVPAKLADHAEIAGARSALTLAEEGRKAKGQLQSLQARVAADPADLQARYDLATALNAMDEREQAADALLEIIRRNRGWNDDAARLQLLKFFEAWGFDDPATTAGAAPAIFRAVQLDGRLPPQDGGLAGRVPGFSAAGRAAAAARQAAAANLRTALCGDDRGRARPGAHVRHDPAGSHCAGNRHRAGPVPGGLPGATVVVQRDRRRPLSDHADRA